MHSERITIDTSLHVGDSLSRFQRDFRDLQSRRDQNFEGTGPGVHPRLWQNV